jgi:hypothetical protein
VTGRPKLTMERTVQASIEEVDSVIELHEVGAGVRMVLTFEALHDDHWTRMATLGRESQLARLDALLASRR